MTEKFFLRAATAADVSPSFDATWTNTTDARRRLLARSRSSADTLASGDARTWTAGEVRLDRQYVSDPLAAGIDFTGATISGVLRLLESNADDNAFLRFGLRVCSQDGTIIRATLLAVGAYGSGTEINAGTNASRRFADDEALSAYITHGGDRLVAEIGFADSTGTSPSVTATYGSSSNTTAGGTGDDHLMFTEGSSGALNPSIEIVGVSLPLLPAGSGSVKPYIVSPYIVRPC